MTVVSAILVPHPPLIVPAVGRGQEAGIAATAAAYARAAAFLRETAPETVVIVSPHAQAYADWFHISPGPDAEGSFGAFGAPGERYRVEYDEELVRAVCALARREGFPAGTEGERDPALDHGFLVPLYFLRRAWGEKPLPRFVRVGLSGMSYGEHYRLGTLLRDAADSLGRRIAVVGSGDLSHKLRPEGPYGFAAEGPAYDGRLMDVMGRGAFGELLAFDPAFCERAAECGHRAFAILAGCLDGASVTAQTLCHEGPFGVGYGVCTFLPGPPDPERRFLVAFRAGEQTRLSGKRAGEDPFVRLARRTVEGFVRTGTAPALPQELPEELTGARAGVFVSLHESGQLRGCIGTISPAEPCVAEEIRANAVSACSRDPRFSPVRPEELERLEYSVDVLGGAEDVKSPAELDPKKYGVIVSRDGRRGLLLPDLAGVDTAQEQIAIARRKAGIDPEAPVRLQRFEVVRHT